MTPDTAANALLALVGIVALCAFKAGPWNWAMNDYFRDKMFAARDELFDAAANGEIAVDDPGYQATRDAINSMIRFAHTLSLARLAVFVAMGARRPASAAGSGGPWDVIQHMPESRAKDLVRKALYRAELAALALVFAKSPFTVTAVVAVQLGPVALLRRGRAWCASANYVPAPFRQYSDLIHFGAKAR